MSLFSKKRFQVAAGIGAIAAATFLLPVSAMGQDQSNAPVSNAAPDNSVQNKDHNYTADQQSNHRSDVQITRDIRRAIVKDKSLSTYAHNVKIITRDGSVTLKGPVASEDEKQSVGSKAEAVTGSADKVDNQLTVKTSDK